MKPLPAGARVVVRGDLHHDVRVRDREYRDVADAVPRVGLHPRPHHRVCVHRPHRHYPGGDKPADRHQVSVGYVRVV